MRFESPTLVWVALIIVLAAVGCAEADADPIGSPIFNGTTPTGEVVLPPITTLPPPEVDALRVPAEYFSIQEAVDAAQPGDLVLLDPGIYTEEVVISAPDIVLRGRDRETVFIDGVHGLATGITIWGDGVAVENLTVRNYTLDAISIGEEVLTDAPPVDGVRIGFVTTSNTGRHGIAARGSTNVEIQQAWTSGHGGAGVLIQDCASCQTVVRDSVAEFSGRGFALVGTDGSTQLLTSTARNNRVGVAIEDGELPTNRSVVAGMLILNNGFSNTPQVNPVDDHGYGAGIHVTGTSEVQLVRNRISGNIKTGILLGSSGSAVDQSTTVPRNVTLDGNVIDIHPEGEIIDVGAGQVWSPFIVDSIPYANGPVPTGIGGTLDADSAVPTPAGPVTNVDIAAIVAPVI